LGTTSMFNSIYFSETPFCYYFSKQYRIVVDCWFYSLQRLRHSVTVMVITFDVDYNCDVASLMETSESLFTSASW
jgi:hypothetical protein